MSSKLIPGLENVCGGAAIEILARGGLISAFPFSTSMSHYSDCNFSFSGIFMNFLQHMKRLETKFSKAFVVHHKLRIQKFPTPQISRKETLCLDLKICVPATNMQ
jgi:tRNA A37 threonylcarbamoyltransferase TsaD